MDKFLKWLEIPINIFMFVGLLAGVLMMTHVSLDVAGRALYQPLIGTNEIVSGYYMILVAYLPWALVTRNDQHITVELFTRGMSPTVVAWLDVLAKILTIAYVSIFVWQTWFRALQQMAAGEALQIGAGYIDVWPSRFVLPVAGFLMVLYLVVRVARDTRDLIRR